MVHQRLDSSGATCALTGRVCRAGLGNCNWNEMVPESSDRVCHFHTRILPGRVHRINCNWREKRVLLQHSRNPIMGLEESDNKKGRYRLLVNGTVWYTH